jgi:hypothetical protein
MKLSLTLIAAFCLLKSFASGLGFAWYNEDAKYYGSCTAADVTMIDDAVKGVFAQFMGTATTNWVDLQYGPDRKLRGRDLCTEECIKRCWNIAYMCYGSCAGCKIRSMIEIDRELVVSKEQMESHCAKKVQGEAKNVSPKCAAAIQNALCEVAL